LLKSTRKSETARTGKPSNKAGGDIVTIWLALHYLALIALALAAVGLLVAVAAWDEISGRGDE